MAWFCLTAGDALVALRYGLIGTLKRRGHLIQFGGVTRRTCHSVPQEIPVQRAPANSWSQKSPPLREQRRACVAPGA